MTPAGALPRPAAQRRVPLWLVLGFIGTVAGTLVGLTLDPPLVAMVVPLVGVGAWAVLKIHLKYTASFLLFSSLLFEGLQTTLEHKWASPLMPLARLMLINLNAITGIGPLRLPMIDMLVVVLALAAVVKRRDPTFVSQTPGVRPLNAALLVSALTVIGLDVLGGVQGGNMNESLWQMRHSLLFPLRALILIRAFDGTDRELKNLVRLIIVAGVLKAMVGIFYVYTWIKPYGREIEFTTSHTDTLLFVPLLAIFFNMLVERVRGRMLVEGLIWVPIVTYGMILNDRRLAYVCLGVAVIITMLMSPPTAFKRLLMRGAVISAPFVPPYLLIGWGSDSGIFFGAKLLKSLVVGDPDQGAQPDYRDLENANVLFTWFTHGKVIPWGFGHEMKQFFPLPDISSAMPTWLYHPHNQYLWLLTIGGPVGFTLIMLPQLVTIYLFARTYRVATDFWVRVWCLTGIAIVAAFFNQVFGDMGTLSWTPSWMAALCAALASKLAVRTGAWPKPPPKPARL
ncbi:MAG: hypothetical protein JNK82_25360 [Myxococcaceae bacterium]|nr:hypothetical protein [Myxococcaceae bacterium]